MIFNETIYNKNWDIKSLKELGTFSRGRSKHRPRNDKILFENGSYPLIQTSDVKKSNLYIFKYSSTYNEEGLKQSKMWDAGTLCITIAANIADTGILKFPMCFPDSVVGFKAYEDVSSELFMHYIFSYIKKCINKTVSGSIQDNINIEYLSNLKLRIPNKEHQDKIISVLTSIDNKIDNNNLIINEIERYMSLKYNYWFEQFKNMYDNEQLVYNSKVMKKIPENWEVINLGDYLTFEKGIEVGSDNYVEDKFDDPLYIKFFRVSDIDDTGNTYTKKELISNIRVKSDDILVSFDGTPGKIGIGLEGSYSTGMKKVYDKNNILNNAVIYTIFNSDYIKYIINQYSTGSNIKHASESLNHMFIPFSKNEYIKFREIITPKFNLMLNLKLENNKLKEMREFLLPLLMTGQIKIK